MLGRTKEKSPNWLGGKSYEPYTMEFDEILKGNIRKRDNHKCRICEIKQSKLNYKLNIHHIDYIKRNCNEDNLITLCKSCHMKTNYDRENWKEYFKVL